MSLGMRGADGINQRMQEITGKMDQMFGPKRSTAAPSAPPSPTSAGRFDDLLASNLGEFGGPIGSMDNGILRPMSVDGLQVTPDGSDSIHSLIPKAAAEYGLDPQLFSALVEQESGFDPKMVSNKGAMGLTQLMPGTARMLGVTNPMDPMDNLRGGAKYLKSMLDQFGGNTRLALAAYNAGPGAVRKYNGVPPFSETQNYVNKILSRAAGGTVGR